MKTDRELFEEWGEDYYDEFWPNLCERTKDALFAAWQDGKSHNGADSLIREMRAEIMLDSAVSDSTMSKVNTYLKG